MLAVPFMLVGGLLIAGSVAATQYTGMLVSGANVQRSASTSTSLNQALAATAASSALCTGSGEVVNGVSCTGAGLELPPADAFAGGTREPTNAASTGGGLLPAAVPGAKTDGWGRHFIYCPADPATLSGSTATIGGNPAFALISAGPDGKADSTCTDALTDVFGGDDSGQVATVAEALDRVSDWKQVTSTSLSFGAADPTNVRIGIGRDNPSFPLDVAGDAWIDGRVLTPSYLVGSRLGINVGNPAFNIHGVAATGDFTTRFVSGGSVAGRGDLAITIPEEATPDMRTEFATTYGFKFRQTGAAENLSINQYGIGINGGSATSSAPIQHSSGARLTSAGVWTDASDRRTKTDIKPLSYGLDTVKALRPVAYTSRLDGRAQVGFIAQEVHEIVPELVDVPEDSEEIQTLSYGQMTAVLTKAVQELSSEVERLKAEIKELKKGGNT